MTIEDYIKLYRVDGISHIEGRVESVIKEGENIKEFRVLLAEDSRRLYKTDYFSIGHPYYSEHIPPGIIDVGDYVLVAILCDGTTPNTFVNFANLTKRIIYERREKMRNQTF